MARKPGSGRCVHCLREFQARNWDHVFPRSWYPDSTPLNMEKWKIPSCFKCNSDYGRLEEELFVMLAMTVTPDNEASLGIYKRALNSVDESRSKGKHDRLIRRARKRKVLASFLHADEIPEEGIYPGLGERWGRLREEQVAFVIPASYLDRLCEKIVRGITYRESGNFIEPPFAISFYPLDENNAAPARALLDRHGTTHARGPGFNVVRLVPLDEPQASMFKITLFGEVVMYAFVTRKEG